MKTLNTIILLILLTTGSFAHNRFYVSGPVRSAETGEALIGVTVYDTLTNTGTITNQYGFYSLMLVKGKHVLKYSYLDYKSKVVEIDLTETTEFTIELAPKGHEMAETNIQIPSKRKREIVTEL